MIQMFHVYKNYEGSLTALSDITLKVDRGEFIFITGPSGAGKTTLLKLIFGTETPTEGQIIIDGRNQSRVDSKYIAYLRKKMGFVFQDFKLLPKRTVYENVALALEVMGIPPKDVKKRVLRALSYVGLKHRANYKPLALSGGEQQRVAVARALVKEPTILLADEPTGNLDPDLSISIIDLFKDINTRGTTVVVATHDKMIIERANKRMIQLQGGRVVG